VHSGRRFERWIKFGGFWVRGIEISMKLGRWPMKRIGKFRRFEELYNKRIDRSINLSVPPVKGIVKLRNYENIYRRKVRYWRTADVGLVKKLDRPTKRDE
jgi:hypothetical protein